MGKKVIQLTESELAKIIMEATIQSLNEMDGATYARIYNATHHAKDEIQANKLQRIKTTTTRYKKNGELRKKPILHKILVNNDDYIAKGRAMEKRAQEHWLKDFIGKTFKFFGEDRMGIPADVLLNFERITKLDYYKTILIGTVTFNQTQICGDGIIVDFVHNHILYHKKGDRYAYELEIDSRNKQLWNELLGQIKLALDSQNRKKPNK